MWRCINRLDYGKKYCLNSITVQENDLHAVIVRALKRFIAENESTYLTLMKATIGDAIGINGGSDEIDLLTRRVETLNKRMITLVNETIQSGGDMESNEDEFKDISEQIEQLIIEDCGGPAGLEHLREVFQQKSSPEYQSMREWLGTSEVDLSVFDLQDLNFRLKKLPRIFRDLYEYDYPPTKHSIDLLDRKYCKTN